jgi:hypothetical protein
MQSKDEEKYYTWILAVIDTCTEDVHFEGVAALINNFYSIAKNETMADQLKEKSQQKVNTIAKLNKKVNDAK